MPGKTSPIDIPAPQSQPWMSEIERNFREGIVENLSKLLETNPFLVKQQITSMELIPEGVVSVVYRAYTHKQDLVIKTGRKVNLLTAQTAASEVYESLGIKVPHILKTIGAKTNQPYLQIMQYIDAPLLSKETSAKKRIELGISKEVGKTLFKMQKPGLKGYGNLEVAEGTAKGLHPNFEKQIEVDVFVKRVPLLIKHNLAKDSHIEKAKEATQILSADLKQNTKPVLCNYDLTPNNIFMTNPLTYFDFKPKISHPYMDLANSVINSYTYSEDSSLEEGREILKGYEEAKDEAVAKDLLTAAINIMWLYKLESLVRKGNEEKVAVLGGAHRKLRNFLLY